MRGVLVGGGSQDRRKEPRAKRRYDIALGAGQAKFARAEIRLPALPGIRPGWRLVSAALVAALVFLIYTAWNAPTYRVLAAEVEGLERLTSQEINAAADVSTRPIFLIEPEKVRQQLQSAFPELASVSVKVVLPARVLVTVEERLPVLVWERDEETLWVDAMGVAFPPRGESAPPVRVEAHDDPPGSEPEGAESDGAAPAYFLTTDLVEAVLAMGEQVPEDTSLVYTRDHGLGWEEHGWEVYFGNQIDDMSTKLRIYKAIAKQLKKDHLKPEFISVEYVHAPYYRLER
jgi:cell division septal protein FtsQ